MRQGLPRLRGGGGKSEVLCDFHRQKKRRKNKTDFSFFAGAHSLKIELRKADDLKRERENLKRASASPFIGGRRY